MTPIQRKAYDEACEEQAAWFSARGINSWEDYERYRREDNRARVVEEFRKRIGAAIAAAKEVL